MAQGLVRFDERGQVVPGLAERWNVSDDGLSYIFRLQTGEWPDGRKISAEDIARILSRQLRPASTNPLKDTLGAVSEIVAMTDRVIEIRLSAPRPNLLQLLAQPEFGLVRASVGTGPFRWPTNEEAAAIPPGRDQAGRAYCLTHRIRIPDAEDPIEKVRITRRRGQELVAAFAEGDLDLVLGGTVGDLPYALARQDAARSAPLRSRCGLVRTGTDRAQRSAAGGGRPAPAKPGDRPAGAGRRASRRRARTARDAAPGGAGRHWQFRRSRIGWASRSEERRASLIAEATRLFGETERPTFRVAVPEGPGGDYLLARLRYDWGPIGIKVERAPSPASADLVWIDEVAPSSSPAWFLRRFRCGVAAICVEEAEQLLAEARATPDPRQRASLFLEAARLMDEAQLFIPIAAPIRWSLVSGRVPGFAENPFARHTLVGLVDTGLSAEVR